MKVGLGCELISAITSYLEVEIEREDCGSRPAQTNSGSQYQPIKSWV
jgi:hypothetical protein